MPPIPLMVLNSLADDWESIETMRDHGEVAPYGLALVDEGLVIEVVRALMGEGLVEVREEDWDRRALVPVPEPRTDQASLRRYWFRPTDAGDRVWREGHDVLEAYFDAHPPGDHN